MSYFNSKMCISYVYQNKTATTITSYSYLYCITRSVNLLEKITIYAKPKYFAFQTLSMENWSDIILFTDWNCKVRSTRIITSTLSSAQRAAHCWINALVFHFQKNADCAICTITTGLMRLAHTQTEVLKQIHSSMKTGCIIGMIYTSCVSMSSHFIYSMSWDVSHTN